MSKRKATGSTNGGGDDYEVGYGKPPKHRQFRPGQSGNPAGRRKGLRNLMTDVQSTLATPVQVTEGGRRRTRSTQQGVLLVLREMALHGQARAIELMFKLAQQSHGDAAETGPAQPLAADDQAILDAYFAKIASAASPATAESADDGTSSAGATDDGTSSPGTSKEKKASK
jgi:hypothetical protein